MLRCKFLPKFQMPKYRAKYPKKQCLFVSIWTYTNTISVHLNTFGMLLCAVSVVGHPLQISSVTSHHSYQSSQLQYSINNSYLITCTVIQSL